MQGGNFKAAMTPVVHRLRAAFSRRSRVDPRLWLFGALLLAIGTALWVGYAAALPSYESPALPWWAFALAFFGAARLAAMDSPRRGTQAITMAAAPFVVGLFHATPSDLLLGYVVGTGLSTAMRRPFGLWQTAFDLVRFVVFASIGIWVFRMIAGSPSLPVWHSAVAALAATVITVLRRAISEAVLLRPRDRNSWFAVGYHLGSAYVAAITSMCIGLIAVRLIPVDRLALVPLAVVTIAALTTHRAWVRERYDHEAAEFLIGAVDALAGRQLEPSIVLLLNRARAIFHAEIAQLTVFPSQLEAETAGVIVRLGAPDDPSAQMLERRGVREAMVALLRGESRMIGSLMVGGHLDARDFDQRDLKLFRTLATRTTVILENSRMERSIARLAHRPRQPDAVPSAHRSRSGPQRGRQLERRRHLPRHRRLQRHQRHARPWCGRRAARRGGGADSLMSAPAGYGGSARR